MIRFDDGAGLMMALNSGLTPAAQGYPGFS
jgi:hypothetical protein